MILSGELSAGARLSREPDLAAHLGLSRSSLRETVKALSHHLIWAGMLSTSGQRRSASRRRR
jgi:DNA-binding FadR family transcriptional regulator